MTDYLNTRWCDGCGVEITWGPVRRGNTIYCCKACLEGLPCGCADRQELEEERRFTERSFGNNVTDSQS